MNASNIRNPYLSLLRAMWQNGFPWRGILLRCYGAYIVGRFMKSLTHYAFGRAIDILQRFSPERLREVVYWLAIEGGAIFIFWLLHGPARIMDRNVCLKIQQNFELNFYKSLTKLPLTWHHKNHSGDMATRLNRGSNALYEFAESQVTYIETMVTFLTSLGFLLWISLPIGLLSLFSNVVASTAALLFDRKLIVWYHKQNEIENKARSLLVEYFHNISTVLTLRLGKLTHSKLVQRMHDRWPFFKKEVVFTEVKVFTIEMLLVTIQTAILISYVLYSLRMTGQVMIGMVVMMFKYQRDLIWVFQELSRHYTKLGQMNTGVRGLDPILKDIQQYMHQVAEKTVMRSWHTIQIQDLVFQHSNLIDKLLSFEKLNFTIQRGEKIALIGFSGSGKSTLLNLLAGVYTPSYVRLLIDDTTTFDSLDPLGDIVTLIPQDPEIFSNTISANIAMGLPAEPEELAYVMQLARFTTVLDQLQDGVSTYIYEKGVNLSVGQKQQLAVARGLFAARLSSLVLIDEPTSSIDVQTEQAILSSIMQASATTSMIISLKRLNFLTMFDRVMMLGKEGIIAYGPVSQLLHQSGPVRELWQQYQSDMQTTYYP